MAKRAGKVRAWGLVNTDGTLMPGDENPKIIYVHDPIEAARAAKEGA